MNRAQRICKLCEGEREQIEQQIASLRAQMRRLIQDNKPKEITKSRDDKVNKKMKYIEVIYGLGQSSPDYIIIPPELSLED